MTKELLKVFCAIMNPFVKVRLWFLNLVRVIVDVIPRVAVCLWFVVEFSVRGVDRGLFTWPRMDNFFVKKSRN
jgi:hypothetical protein